MSETKPILSIAQISDSHLFSNKTQLHHGANVYNNLENVLIDIAGNTNINRLIFTGDLTQDHTEASYQNFSDLIKKHCSHIEFNYLPGNHDELFLLEKYLSFEKNHASKLIESEFWQVFLLNSKSDTPAGYLESSELSFIQESLVASKYQLVMLHHHPINVGYFIDLHGLKNQAEFWQVISQQPTIKALACGHVHRSMRLKHPTNSKLPMVYTCPATSIEFDIDPEHLVATDTGAGYQVFHLMADGQFNVESIYL